MIRVYTVEEALASILVRRPLHLETFSPATIARTEALFGPGVMPPEAVTRVLRSVSAQGDSAVTAWSALLDGYTDSTIRVLPEQLADAGNELPDRVRYAMATSVERIRRFHEQRPAVSWLNSQMGGRIGQRFTPIRRVGIYVPGGTAPLPSSLLMAAIPAQVAGVKSIVVCTPPPAHPSILAAAHLCGVHDVYQIGGAQAIAALAFGTETVPKVDKIVGAGNLFVTLAKQQVYGVVGLDGLAGPTETMIIADVSANPAWVAADLLAQAEHDVQAGAILLTPAPALAEAVQEEVCRQAESLTRREIIGAALENRGGVVIVESLDQAAELADEYAPEHLCLSVREPEALMQRIDNAGGFFVGEHSYEVLGDYIAGPSHVMPTGGTARFASPLNVMDFVKMSSVIALDRQSSVELSPEAAVFAAAEGLTAHAAAALARVEESV